MDTKRSSNKKDLSAPNSHRNTPTPAQKQKSQSPIPRKENQKGKITAKHEMKVDETPRWSNNLRKHESPFREPQEKSFSLPSVEEIDGNRIDSHNEIREESHATLPKPESITIIDDREEYFEQSPIKNESKVISQTQQPQVEKEVRETPVQKQPEVRLSVEESARERHTLPQPVEITQNRNDIYESQELVKRANVVAEAEDINPELRRDILEERILELEAQVKSYQSAEKDLYDQIQYSHQEYKIVFIYHSFSQSLIVFSLVKIMMI